MKLEKIFEVKNNRLYKIGGGEVSADGMARRVAWSQVEPTPGEYDEAFLAALRDELKALDARGAFVYIDAVYDRDGEAAQFAAAMKHCARRIKDCVSVAGFSVPERLADGGFADDSAAADYMRELSQKHGQYVYFCKKSAPCVLLLH
ncbi:MAG: hypothetical protein K2M90_00450 [Treponemataceae bacterium]|nr:hypothetical protein [Treponemataceae bacterium]